MAEPNAPTQSSEEFAQSLLDRKWSNEKAANKARKKANRINNAISGLGMIVGGANWLLQQQGRQKYMDLEESMIFDLAAAEKDFNKDLKEAKIWEARELRWKEGGSNVGPYQDAKNTILNRHGWDENIWNNSSGESKNALQIEIDELAVKLQNHHENSRNTMEGILNTDLSTIQAKIASPYRRPMERASNRNLYSMFARNLGLIKEKEGMPQTLSEIQDFTKKSREGMLSERREGRVEGIDSLEDIVQRRRLLGLSSSGPTKRPDKQYILGTDGSPLITEGRNGRKFYSYRDSQGNINNEAVTALNKSPAALSIETLSELATERANIINGTGQYKDMSQNERDDLAYNINKQIFGDSYEAVSELNTRIDTLNAQMAAALSEQEKAMIIARNSTIELARKLQLAETAAAIQILQGVDNTALSEARSVYFDQAKAAYGNATEFDQKYEEFTTLVERKEINSSAYLEAIEDFKTNNPNLSKIQIEALKKKWKATSPTQLKIMFVREQMAVLSDESFNTSAEEYKEILSTIREFFPTK